MMSPERRRQLDKNVSPDWRPVAGLEERKAGMAWSDRVWHWLVSLAGLCVIGVGVAVMAFTHRGHAGGWVVGVGFAIFLAGFPSQAQRNGYRE